MNARPKRGNTLTKFVNLDSSTGKKEKLLFQRLQRSRVWTRQSKAAHAKKTNDGKTCWSEESVDRRLHCPTTGAVATARIFSGVFQPHQSPEETFAAVHTYAPMRREHPADSCTAPTNTPHAGSNRSGMKSCRRVGSSTLRYTSKGGQIAAQPHRTQMRKVSLTCSHPSSSAAIARNCEQVARYLLALPSRAPALVEVRSNRPSPSPTSPTPPSTRLASPLRYIPPYAMPHACSRSTLYYPQNAKTCDGT